jgi:hypothetical protein
LEFKEEIIQKQIDLEVKWCIFEYLQLFIRKIK